jgi:hypothetical protein
MGSSGMSVAGNYISQPVYGRLIEIVTVTVLRDLLRWSFFPSGSQVKRIIISWLRAPKQQRVL